jgi:hypothetical protein
MRRFMFAVAVSTAFAVPAPAAIPASPAPQVASIPQHDDGADYVWRVFCSSGLRYSYIPASQFPVSTRFEEVKKPQTGDIVWWPEYVAIFVEQNASLITAGGMVKMADLTADGSQPHFYRMRVLPGETTGDKPLPGECQRNTLYTGASQTSISPVR